MSASQYHYDGSQFSTLDVTHVHPHILIITGPIPQPSFSGLEHPLPDLSHHLRLRSQEPREGRDQSASLRHPVYGLHILIRSRRIRNRVHHRPEIFVCLLHTTEGHKRVLEQR